MEGEIQAVEIPEWIDLLAVFAAGVAGSLLATKRGFDLTGIFVLAIVAGLGGGIIRDVLIQRGTPAALENSSYLITAVAASAVGFFFAHQVEPMGWAMTGINAVSLGLYTLVGSLKGVEADLPALSVILLGVLSGAGGGMLRDVLLTKTPDVLLPGTPYAILSVVGGVMVVILHEAGANDEWLYWLPVVVVVLLRFVALGFGWSTPVATDLPAQVQVIVPRATRASIEAARAPSSLRRHLSRFRRRDGEEVEPRED